MSRSLRAMAAVFLVLTALSCGPRKITPPAVPGTAGKEIPRMGFTIQAGAFSSPANAAKLTESLRKKKIDAYYFVFKAGLYKVRFGNFPTVQEARKRAGELLQSGVIDEFYIVSPDQYSIKYAGGDRPGPPGNSPDRPQLYRRAVPVGREHPGRT